MAFADPNTIHNPATGTIPPAAWGDQLRDNDMFLYASPQCRAYNSAAQNVTTGTATALALNSERFDTDAMHDTATNNTRITCKTAGKYLIGGSFEFPGNATGTERAIRIRINGADTVGGLKIQPESADAIRLSCTALISMAVNDYVELVAFQDSGSTLSVPSTAQISPEFWASWQSS